MPIVNARSSLVYGPEHALLRDLGRVQYATASDDEALAAFGTLSHEEGIIPALETAHALAFVLREAKSLVGRLVVVNLSGRGDKDLALVPDPAEGGGQ